MQFIKKIYLFFLSNIVLFLLSKENKEQEQSVNQSQFYRSKKNKQCQKTIIFKIFVFFCGENIYLKIRGMYYYQLFIKINTDLFNCNNF